MKSLMVVSQKNDPFYIDYDAEFAKYIIDRAKSGGLLEKDADVTELDTNLVMQLFSPLVLSQWLLIDQTREPCSSILCPDGLLFAFKQTDDLLFIALNGDGTETETFLHRKIQVFMTIIRFMFGPACEEMDQSHLYSKKGKWDFLHQLMQSWTDLAHSEQAFLVEAIERVHVNQMMNEKCLGILQKSVKLFTAAKDQQTDHAFLLVNSKLLALYSNRNAHELRPKDLLMTMIVSRTMYPQTDKLEDLFSKFYVTRKPQRSYTTDDNSDAGEEEYHSAPTTPGSHRSQSPTSLHKSQASNYSDSSDEDPQRDTIMENMSLLAMFKEKCQNVAFTKENDEDGCEHKLAVKNNQIPDGDGTVRDSNMPSQVMHVQAVIHNEEDSNVLVQEDEAPWVLVFPEIGNQENITNPDLNNSNQENFNNKISAADVEVLTFAQSQKVKHESGDGKRIESLHNIISSEKADKSSGNQIETLAIEITSPVQSNEQMIVKKTENFSVRGKTETAVPDNLLIFGKHELVGSSQVGKQNNEGRSVSPAFNPSVRFSSVEQHVSVLSGIESVMAKDTTARNRNDLTIDPGGSRRSSQMDQSSKSGVSTPSQQSGVSTPSQQSGEPEEISRSSSVISNLSKGYPELLPQTGEDFQFTGARIERPEDLYNVAAKSKRIKATVESHKPEYLLRTSAPAVTLSTTESTSITPNVDTSLSVFSSSSIGSGRGIYLPQTIFLETSTCLYSPYNLYTVQVSQGLTLILLSQAHRNLLADSLYQVIQTIQDVIYGRRSKLPRSRSINVYDTIHSQLGKVHNNLKKVKGKGRGLSHEVLTRWEKDEFKHKLLNFLERDSSFRLPTELESQLMELYKRLRELFSHLFLSPVNCSSELWESLAQIRGHLRAELLDYREYLNVKAQRNITMTSYIDEFPGLIHFIFIDRHFHQMTAPSLNISLKAGENTDATNYLKEKIWVMHQHMMSKLTDGYTTVMMRDGDFCFSYFLWFEDYMGNPLPVQESYKPPRKQAYPGILCGQFYRDLLLSCFPHAIQGSIHCNEVFMMHLGTVHPTYIATHCRKLAYKMWEMSGEINNSVNLL